MPQVDDARNHRVTSLDAFAQAKLAELEGRTLRRRLRPTTRIDGLTVERDGRRLLSFSCNDYLNLSHHPRVKAAAAAAVETFGAGAGASRLVTGDHPLVEALEAALARFKGTEAACVFGSGYVTNLGVIPAFVGEGDLVLLDELSHSCIWAGAQMSKARVIAFRHNDVDDLERLLKRERGLAHHVLVATEGVFSMDGDLAPLRDIGEVCRRFDAWLLNDDAHGLGVLADGRGSVAAAGAEVPLQMGTLSKALGSFGGYVCGSQAVIDLIKTRARTLIYATGLPPGSAAAALEALAIVESEPELCARPLSRARLFTRRLGLPRAQSAIVPLVLGSPEAALAAQSALEQRGFLAVAIRPPTVPAGTSRLRFAFTAGHNDDQIEALAEAITPAATSAAREQA
jgi:8-amino-7-oxononanoate synthase